MFAFVLAFTQESTEEISALNVSGATIETASLFQDFTLAAFYGARTVLSKTEEENPEKKLRTTAH
jgi:hypothetical protein